MRAIDREFFSTLSTGPEPRCTWQRVASDPGCGVKSFATMVDHIAEISFRNPDMNLYYRGQDKDYRDRAGHSTLRPNALRRPFAEDKPTNRRYYCRVLEPAAKVLLRLLRCRMRHYRGELLRAIERFPEAQWAILQHYGFATPLLDVSQSLHVAATFACMGANGHGKVPNDEPGFVYVLWFPNINGHISYFAYECLVIAKLQAVCPPEAKRPHLQQGFLVGTFPHKPQAWTYAPRDFQQRLVAKFRIANPKTFWCDTGYWPVPREALMPEKDEVASIVCELKDRYEEPFRTELTGP